MKHQWAIFTIHFGISSQKELFLRETDGTSVLDNAQAHFGSYFGGSQLTLYKTKESGEVTPYPNDILRKEGDIILLRVNNVQYKKLVKRCENALGGVPRYAEVQAESNPFSYVVIDNRPGCCLMAIELSATWGSRSEPVRNLLQECLGRSILNDYGLEMLVNAKMHPTKFWEFVHHQVHNNGDRINGYIIEVLNKKRVAPREEESGVKPRGLMKSVSDFVEHSNLLKASMTLQADGGMIPEKSKAQEDWANIVQLCSSSYYNLTVKFERMGLYRSDQEVMALFPLADEAIEHFIQGCKTFSEQEAAGEYALVSWLDFVRKEIKDYNDAKQTPKKPERKRKK